MNIPMPTPQEKEISCNFILKKAYPPSFSRKLYTTIKALGFRNLWVGVEWCVLIPTLSTILFLYLQVPQVLIRAKMVPFPLFFVAPLFYGSLLSLTLWKEQVDQMYPLKQTCYFSTAQLTSLRCLSFGATALLLQVLTVVIVVLFGGQVEISALLLSFSMLFCYGGCSLFLLRLGQNLMAHSVTLALWILIALQFRQTNSLLPFFSVVGSGFFLFFLIPTTLFMESQFKKYFLQGELSC